MNNNYYILDEKGNPVVADLMTWSKWFHNCARHVRNEYVGKYRISTVFLGIDHNFDEGPPVLWETMVFRQDKKRRPKIGSGEWAEIEQDRCSGSREQAEAMHDKMVELVKEKYGRRKTKARKSTRP